jgi:hypothetical protein
MSTVSIQRSAAARSLFPSWTTGFWQSKNRYRSTAEVLGIAREYQRLHIPLSLMIIDEGAWDLLGNEGWGGCSNGSVTMTGEPCHGR